MNEPHDPLEAELASLRPRPPSAALHDRIAEQLSVSPPGRSRWPWALALAAGLAGAAIAAAVLLSLWNNPPAEPDQIVTDSPVHPLIAFDDALPSVWTYRLAMQSPEQLDLALDKHATLGSRSGREEQPIHPFARSTVALIAIPGEL